MKIESIYVSKIDYLLERDREQVEENLYDSEIELGAVSGDSSTGFAGGSRSSIRPRERWELTQWEVIDFKNAEFDSGYIWFLTQIDGISCTITTAKVANSSVKLWQEGPNKGGLFTLNIQHEINSVTNDFVVNDLSSTTLVRLIPKNFPDIKDNSSHDGNTNQESGRLWQNAQNKFRNMFDNAIRCEVDSSTNKQTIDEFITSISDSLEKLGFPFGGYMSVVDNQYVLSADQILTPRDMLYSIELQPIPTRSGPVIQWMDKYVNPLIIYNSVYFLQEDHVNRLDKFEELLERVETQSRAWWQQIVKSQDTNPSISDANSQWRTLYNRVVNEQRSIENVISRIEETDSTPEASEDVISRPKGDPVYAKKQSLLTRLSTDVHKQQERVSEQLEKASVMHEQTTSLLYNQIQTRSAEINRRLQYAVIALTIVTAFSALVNILGAVSIPSFITSPFLSIIVMFSFFALLEMSLFSRI